MKNKKKFILILVITAGLSALSVSFFNQKPVTFFILKNEVDGVKVFKVGTFFVHQKVLAENVSLNARQMGEAKKVFLDKNLNELKAWSKSFGDFNFVIGVSETEEDFISFWNHFFSFSSASSFDDLNFFDKLYFDLILCPKLAAQDFGVSTISTSSRPSAPAAALTTQVLAKTPDSLAIVRVEILNGCGIKGAAEWVAERIKSQRIVVKNGGNADNFTYANSQIRVMGEMPPDINNTLKQLGFSDLAITHADVPPGYNVLLIVGKDFQKTKGN